MRAISLWQPWASAVAMGSKRIETRHWATNYRGPLAIHASKRWDRDQKDFAAVEKSLGRLPADIPLGAIVAVCQLVDCIPTEDLMLARTQFNLTAVEQIYGNYETGRYGWLLEDIRPLPDPISYRGRQSFFTIPNDVFPGEIVSPEGTLI